MWHMPAFLCHPVGLQQIYRDSRSVNTSTHHSKSCCENNEVPPSVLYTVGTLSSSANTLKHPPSQRLPLSPSFFCAHARSEKSAWVSHAEVTKLHQRE
ncbi:hypothetical protein F7725_024068 [Dissostichus mawsoni]|uniref:Uncharacterized protein n=1 Tax=Dissostichus mawsoni TaxID=36200 RepID=A0A7J5Y085_DISMA|nr:hypothetical protein F7725_024068 [Dissostichus mawsoni]